MWRGWASCCERARTVLEAQEHVAEVGTGLRLGHGGPAALLLPLDLAALHKLEDCRQRPSYDALAWRAAERGWREQGATASRASKGLGEPREQGPLL